MGKFVGRKRELEELNRTISKRKAQFILVYGRRRVGKTTLLLNWAEQSGRPYIYWVANRDTPAQVRLGFTRALWRWAHPDSQAVPPSPRAGATRAAAPSTWDMKCRRVTP